MATCPLSQQQLPIISVLSAGGLAGVGGSVSHLGSAALFGSELSTQKALP